MKRNILFLFACLIVLPVVSQKPKQKQTQTQTQSEKKKEPAYICFYHADKVLCNSLFFDIQLNNTGVFTLKPTLLRPSSFQYIILSEGRLNITVRNPINNQDASTFLEVAAGKTYYVKIDCSISSLYLSVNGLNSEYEWGVASLSNLMTMMEDPSNPIIKPDYQLTGSTPVQKVVKTDTVRRTIYVNTVQTKKYIYEPYADVDLNIPATANNFENRFALVIGNEDYSSFQPDLKTEANVAYARNDASTFKNYLNNVLGVPEKNTILLLDATYGQITQAISKMNLIAKNTGGKAELIVYYAGHGMPDEITKEPYIIPVDISGANVTSGIKLKDVYTKLTEFPAERVYVFMDACFTGGARGEGLVAGRGISVKPKDDFLKGNIVVFSSSSGNQSSLPYNEKKHGLYTYYLLKKLQETKGDITAKELSFYLKEKVGIESVLVNDKEQNPQARTSADASEKWTKWKLND